MNRYKHRTKKILFAIIASLSWLQASSVVPSDDYLVEGNESIAYIYSDEYRPMMSGLKSYDAKVLAALSKEYGYRFDEKLYVMLASQNNQISNAFSTQIPFNAQLHYGAGAGGGGLSATVGWMKMLLIHESAHNFQLNAKENTLSKVSHNIFGANFLTILGFVPLLPLPNYFLGRFLLEGNAVLNESRFGLGGRLYSSAIIAENVLLARGGKLTSERVYNNILEYPYSSQFYHVGGLFQAYLAERYGAKRVNSFYKEHSKSYLPFMINESFKRYFGEDLETLIDTFRTVLLEKYKGFQTSTGEEMFHGESLQKMQRNGNNIDLLLSNLRKAPVHKQIDSEGQVIVDTQTTYPQGRMFLIDGKYYTQSTQSLSSKRIIKGLYDENAKLLQGTDSKIIQGVMPDRRLVYVDVKHSYERWHLYVGKEFYSVVDSEALVMPSGDIYYFKQEGKRRVAYKNHHKLFSYEGYYGTVCDVDAKGRLYFVASSKEGTALYRYDKEGIVRVGKGDDVIDMKLLHHEHILVAVIRDDGIAYLKQRINTFPSTIATVKYGFTKLGEEKESMASFSQIGRKSKNTQKANSYHPLSELHYSTFSPFIGYNSVDGMILGGEFTFVDPLGYNSLNIPFHIENDYKMLGFRYENQAEVLRYRMELFGIMDANKTLGYRDFGVSLEASYPFLKEGYETGSISLCYDQPYDTLTQKPLSLNVHWDETKQYGYSMYPNDAHSVDMFISDDRGTDIFGLEYTWWHDFGDENYISLNANYLKSSDYHQKQERGITITKRKNDYAYNLASLEMYGLKDDIFVDEALKAEIGLYKVFNVSKYFFSFPLSLQRESLYAKARYYTLGQDGKNEDYVEFVVGTQIDALLDHELSLPLNIEWIHNENAYEKDSVKFTFGFSF